MFFLFIIAPNGELTAGKHPVTLHNLILCDNENVTVYKVWVLWQVHPTEPYTIHQSIQENHSVGITETSDNEFPSGFQKLS